MNQDDQTPHEDPRQAELDELTEALAPLRELQPPPSTHLANATRVTAELDRMKRRRRRHNLPWWRRTVSIPLPVAALVVLALLMLPLQQVWNSNRHDAKPAASNAERTSQQYIANPVTPEVVMPDSAPVPCEPVLYQEQTVIAGLGTIRSIQYYKCESDQQ